MNFFLNFFSFLNSAEPYQIIILGLIIVLRYFILSWIFLPSVSPKEKSLLLFNSVTLFIFWYSFGFILILVMSSGFILKFSFLVSSSLFAFLFLFLGSLIIPVLDLLDSYFKAKGYQENTIFVVLDLTLFILLFLIISLICY